jgi:outer membrane protein W
MKYKILYVFTLCLFIGTGTINAQNEGKAKRFSGAILFGNGIYLAEPAVPSSPGATDWTISGEAPYASGISSDNQLTNMIGAEFRYFVTNKIALKLNGSGIIRNTPAADNVTGVTPATSGAVSPSTPSSGWIPNYEATVMNNSLNINVSVGGEYHIATTAKLSPYIAVMIPFCYGRSSQYNPTATVDVSKGTLDSAVTIADVGNRHIETIGFGGQLVFGADYNLTESLFIGLEIKPVSYLYAYNTKYPGPGLETRSAETNTFGFFTQPIFKLGVRF